MENLHDFIITDNSELVKPTEEKFSEATLNTLHDCICRRTAELEQLISDYKKMGEKCDEK